MSDSFEIKLNQALRQEISSITPNRVDDLLARLGEQPAPQAAPVAEAAASKRKTYRPRWQLLAAAVLALILLGSGIFYGVRSSRRSVIILDADAPVAFVVDGFNRVRSVRLENASAASSITSDSLVGKPLEKAVADATEQLIAADLLSEEENAVLISVQESEQKRAESLTEIAIRSLRASATEHAITPVVILQTIGEDAPSIQGASLGKTAFVDRLMGGIEDQKTADLVHAALEDLLYYSGENAITPAQVTTQGTLNESIFRTAENAEEIARADSGYDASEASVSTLLGWERSDLVYFATVDAGSRIGYYCISARTGEILSVVWEELGTPPADEPEHTIAPVPPAIVPTPTTPVPTLPPTRPPVTWDVDDFNGIIDFWDDII